MPGAGLRQAQPSSGPCGQTWMVSKGPSSSSSRAHARVDLLAGDEPAGDAGLVADHADLHAAGAQPVQRLLRAVHRPHPVGVAVVGEVVDQGAVAVEEHQVGQAAPRAHAAGAARRRAASARWPAAGWPRWSRASWSTSRAVARAGRDARPGELRRAGQPGRPRRGRRPAAAGRAASPTAASAAAVTAVCCGRRPSAASARAPPVRPVQPAHEDVVGVAGLHAHADPAVGRPHRVGDPALPADQPRAGVHDPQRQVGVLAEGAGEALVEAADRGQRGAAVGEVGGDPAAGGQARGAALPVGGPAVARAAARAPGPGCRRRRPAGRRGRRPAARTSRGRGRRRRRGRRSTRVRAVRQPRLRARAGPPPPVRTTRTGGRPGALGPQRARRRAGRRPGRARPGAGPGPRRARRGATSRRRPADGRHDDGAPPRAPPPWAPVPDPVPAETLRA